MSTLTEADVEQAAIDWLRGLRWQIAHGPDIAPGTLNAERADYDQVVLVSRLRDALATLNPGLPADALDGRLSETDPTSGLVAGGPQPRVPTGCS